MSNIAPLRRLKSVLNHVPATHDDATAELLWQVSPVNGALIVGLNRAKQLNALTYDMFTRLDQLFRACDETGTLCVITNGSGNSKAFSSGGDMKQLALSSIRPKEEQGYVSAIHFIFREYQMDLLISRLQCPYVSVIDGIAMGGGAALAVNGAIRVVTEHVRFAMPETSVHWLPDCGASYFLTHLNSPFVLPQANLYKRRDALSALGLFLGLTGQICSSYDMLYIGIATHFVPRTGLKNLMNSLSNIDLQTFNSNTKISIWLQDRFTKPHDLHVKTEIDKCYLKTNLEEIIACFSPENQASFLDIHRNLVRFKEEKNSVFASKTLAVLAKRPALIMPITHRVYTTGKHLSRSECLRTEYRVHVRVLRKGLFYEGVKRLLIDKQYRPTWPKADNIPYLEQVEASGEVDQWVAPLPVSHHPKWVL